MRDLITGAPDPDLEHRIADLERAVADLRSELYAITDRLDRLEEDASHSP